MITETTEHEGWWSSLFDQLSQHLRVRDDRGQTLGFRQDVTEAMNFMLLDLKGEALISEEEMALSKRFIANPLTPNVYTSISLFWNMFRPWMANAQLSSVNAENMNDWHRATYPPAHASAELDDLLLRCLDWIYGKFRIPYEPDANDSQNLLDLITEFHIAAARAFKLRQLEADPISEEWMSRLRAAEGLANRIRAILRLHPTGGYHTTSFAISTNAVCGMIQLELSRVCRANGSYAEAIHHLDQASTSYIWALDGIEDTRGSDGYWIEIFDRDGERQARLDLRRRLVPLEVSGREAAAPFKLLKESPPSDANWKQIAEDCRGLAILPDLEWKVFSCVEASEYVKDEETCFDLTWSEFWYQSAAYASARLSIGEYRELREADAKDAAERRLTRYFFASGWLAVPERARERLISADETWNSRQRGSRESILNNLMRVVEEMCFSYIAKPFRNTGKAAGLGIRRYIEICEDPVFKNFIAQRQIQKSEIRFLTEDLPAAMRQLADERNSAEHVAGTTAAPDTVTPAFRLFLGIGQPGILPELARIGSKLQKTGLGEP